MALFSREMVFDLYLPKIKLGFKYVPEACAPLFSNFRLSIDTRFITAVAGRIHCSMKLVCRLVLP